MNTNRCVVCGEEIPEGMQVCKKCAKDELIDPCEKCVKNEVRHCWKHCARYKRKFAKLWAIVVGRLRR